jgi:imidazolonepropionase-like amidohydrolase
MHLLGQLFAPDDRGLAVVTVEGDRVTAIDVASDPPSGAIGGPDAAILPGLIDIQVNGAYR